MDAKDAKPDARKQEYLKIKEVGLSYSCISHRYKKSIKFLNKIKQEINQERMKEAIIEKG